MPARVHPDLATDSSPPVSTMRQDVASAYVASFARLGAFALVLGALYRNSGDAAVALFTVTRSLGGGLQYLFLSASTTLLQIASVPTARKALSEPPEHMPGDVLDYAIPAGVAHDSRFNFWNWVQLGQRLSVIAFFLGLLTVLLFVIRFGGFQNGFWRDESLFSVLFCLGLLVRLSSEVHGSVLQLKGRIVLDNAIGATADVLWCCWSVIACLRSPDSALQIIGFAYLSTAFCVAATRSTLVAHMKGQEEDGAFAASQLFDFAKRGLTITAGSLADFLYAPVNILIVKTLLQNDHALAAYAPALQVDAALLLLVTGLASVMLPKSAVAHAAGDHALLRRYYVRGTLASLGLLTVAAGVVAILSQTILTLWLKHPPVLARPILLLVLIHTVIGGSAGVGRSILLATGHAKAYTLAAIAGGVLNIGLALSLAKFTSLGLYAIPLATIVAVTLRCAVWQPIYTLRVLMRKHSRDADAAVTAGVY